MIGSSHPIEDWCKTTHPSIQLLSSLQKELLSHSTMSHIQKLNWTYLGIEAPHPVMLPICSFLLLHQVWIILILWIAPQLAQLITLLVISKVVGVHNQPGGLQPLLVSTWITGVSKDQAAKSAETHHLQLDV
jgi:hypothetical protein